MGNPLQPGKHVGIPFADYLSIKALNSHTLSAAIGRSPLHAKAEMGGGGSSDAKDFGTAVHAAILEPQHFDAHKRILPPINAHSSTQRAERIRLIESEPSAFWLERADADNIETIRANVRAFGLARKVSASKGERECTLLWSRDGVPCKARIDKVCPGVALVDLKTTRDASCEAFGRQAVLLRYHNQAAWYVDGWKAVTGETLPYIIVAVENEYPFAVNCFSVDDDLIECGRRENDSAFADVAPCWKSGVWTGYPERLNRLYPPVWLAKKVGL